MSRPRSPGDNAEIHSSQFRGVNEIQLKGAERGRPPIDQTGPQGCPVIPATFERDQRAPQQRSGAH